MPPLNIGGAESEVARILKERVERLREGLETLTREFLEPLPLPKTADLPDPLDWMVNNRLWRKIPQLACKS